MNTRHVQLVISLQTVLAKAVVTDEGRHFGGTIELQAMPASMWALFEEFEEVINGQMFAFLDEIQEKINSLPIRVVFDDGLEASIRDLQVFPSTGDLSFRLVDQPPQIAVIATPVTQEYPVATGGGSYDG